MSEHPVKRRKKLIEVAIPLEAINAAAQEEKSVPRKGHPQTLHYWWARRPLAAARAIIFCQMVDDPSAIPEEFTSVEAQDNERLRLFHLVSKLTQWENIDNYNLIQEAQKEIQKSWARCCRDNHEHPQAHEIFDELKLPGLHDPFAGGGTIPLEAQRLGLKAFATDLNPVATLINKALIEIPSDFADWKPQFGDGQDRAGLPGLQATQLSRALSEDIRFYGNWILEKAKARLSGLYPPVTVSDRVASRRPCLKPYANKKLKVAAYIWARTVKSPSPAFPNARVPLTSTFTLSLKKGSASYVLPIIEDGTYRLVVVDGYSKDAEMGTTAGKRAGYRCIMSGEPITYEYIKSQSKKGELSETLLAIVAETDQGRIYLDPEHLTDKPDNSLNSSITWKPDLEMQGKCRVNVANYGMLSFGDLFTGRQLQMLNTISDLIIEAGQDIESRLSTNEESRIYSTQYANAISVYLGCALSRLASYNNTICFWNMKGGSVTQIFSRQAIPMSWDFIEICPLEKMSGSWSGAIDWVTRVVDLLPSQSIVKGQAAQANASSQSISKGKIVSTDPPYYDNISYADLSDFFYVWLRRCLKGRFPDLFATLSVPKQEELIASTARQGSKKSAEEFFLHGMTEAMSRISGLASDAFPVTIYYAFKQSETSKQGGVSSTGWDAFLQAVINAGFSISGTWPIRTERPGGVKAKTNSLASSIVLVCNKRTNPNTISRQEFRRQLVREMKQSLNDLERSGIAPVDIAQAVIGPGMSLYSSATVLNADDSVMSVREALEEINKALDECLSDHEGMLDQESQFALTFFESYGYSERNYGDAEGLAKARNITVESVCKAGIFRSVAGKANLIHRDDLDGDWDPTLDDRLCVWEATQYLIKALEAGGEAAAAALMIQLKQLPGQSDLLANCKALAYRLYNHCEKTKQAEEARAYNGLVIAWPELERLESSQSTETTVQASLI